MTTQADVRQICLSLPGVSSEEPKWFAFGVTAKGKQKAFCWVWLERIHPKKARVPQPKVLAVRVADEIEKAALLGADPDKFFTEPHYNGYPAVLVRLANVTKPELRQLLTQAWRTTAPKLAAEASAKASSPKRSSPKRSSPKRSPKKPPAKRKAKRRARR
ncbi:MAG TPA: MmcQ/YjbR family DNA-binding protein [Kofleriaceae bacterium]